MRYPLLPKLFFICKKFYELHLVRNNIWKLSDIKVREWNIYFGSIVLFWLYFSCFHKCPSGFVVLDHFTMSLDLFENLVQVQTRWGRGRGVAGYFSFLSTDKAFFISSKDTLRQIGFKWDLFMWHWLTCTQINWCTLDTKKSREALFPPIFGEFFKRIILIVKP